MPAEPVKPWQVMPTVYVAGPVKGGTTSIYDCLLSNFHPKKICGATVDSWNDTACGFRRFVLPSIRTSLRSGDSALAVHHMKEGPFGVWGHSATEKVGWRMLTGPALPVRIWARDVRMSSADLDDLCRPAAGHSLSGNFTCDPCELHPGSDLYNPRTGQWRHEPCRSPRKSCASAMCRVGTSDPPGTDPPSWSIAAAVPHKQSLAAANIAPGRVMGVEGCPAVLAGAGLGGMARQLGLLTAGGGRGALRFIVGLREPISLGLSYWMWLQKAHVLRAGPGVFFDKGLEALSHCKRAVGATGQPAHLMHLADNETRLYYACVKASSFALQESDKILAGMYALSLHAFFRAGFKGSQFLLVPSEALADTDVLLRSMSSFLGLSLPSQPIQCQKAATSTDTNKLVETRTLKSITSEFYESAAYGRARDFFQPHNALLARLIHYHKIPIAGEAPVWLQNASKQAASETWDLGSEIGDLRRRETGTVTEAMLAIRQQAAKARGKARATASAAAGATAAAAEAAAAATQAHAEAYLAEAEAKQAESMAVAQVEASDAAAAAAAE